MPDPETRATGGGPPSNMERGLSTGGVSAQSVPAVIFREESPTGGFYVLSNGDYQALEGDPESVDSTITYYRRGTGPEAFRLRADQIHARHNQRLSALIREGRRTPDWRRGLDDARGVPFHMRRPSSVRSDLLLERRPSQETTRRQLLRAAIRLGTELGRLHSHFYALIADGRLWQPVLFSDSTTTPGLTRVTRERPTDLNLAIQSGLIEEVNGDYRIVGAGQGLNTEIARLARELPGFETAYSNSMEAADRALIDESLQTGVMAVLDIALTIITLGAEPAVRAMMARFARSRSLISSYRNGPTQIGLNPLNQVEATALGPNARLPRRGTRAVRPNSTEANSRPAPEISPELLPRRPRPAEAEAPGASTRQPGSRRGSSSGQGRRVVGRLHAILHRVAQTPQLRNFRPVIEDVLNGPGGQAIDRFAGARAPAYVGGNSRRINGAVNSLKGSLQERVMQQLPWFARVRAAAERRLRRVNTHARNSGSAPFSSTVEFSADVSTGGRQLTDGLFFARSQDGTKVVILDVVEAKSNNWRGLYTGRRAQIRRDIERLMDRTVTIDGQTYRRDDGTLLFMTDFGADRQPWTLSVPRQLPDLNRVRRLLTRGAERVSDPLLPSRFVVTEGALPDQEARKLAEIVLDVYAGR